MKVIEPHKVTDREQAGVLLGARLMAYHDADSVVVGISKGGVVVGAKVAELLGLQLEALPCRKIADPADRSKSIGSVCLDEVIIQPCSHDLPQDYISHQIALLIHGMQKEWQQYYPLNNPLSLRYKKVIVVDDALRTGDTMVACLKSIKRKNPLHIIAAVPLVSAEGARRIRSLVDEVVFVEMKPEVQSATDFYKHYPDVEEENVKSLLMVH